MSPLSSLYSIPPSLIDSTPLTSPSMCHQYLNLIILHEKKSIINLFNSVNFFYSLYMYSNQAATFTFTKKHIIVKDSNNSTLLMLLMCTLNHRELTF